MNADRTMWRTRRPWAGYLVIFLVAIAIRVLFLRWFGVPDQTDGDMDGYIMTARNIVEGRGFSGDGVTPLLYRPPLFAGLLAAWCAVWGSTALSTMLAYQVVVQSAAAAVTAALVRRLTDTSAPALAAGLFVAAYPFVFSSVGFMLQEPTQMLVTAATALAIVSWWAKPRLLTASVVGVFCGLCALAKAPNVILPVVIVALWMCQRSVRLRWPVTQIIAVAACGVLLVAPWTLRNYRVTDGQFVLINSQAPWQLAWIVSDGHFEIRTSASTEIEPTPATQQGRMFSYGNPDGRAYMNRVNDELLARRLPPRDVTSGIADAAVRYLLDHPRYVLWQFARGSLLAISPDARTLFGESKTIRIAATAMVHVPLFILFLAGTRRAVASGHAAAVILGVWGIVYFGIHLPGGAGTTRYAVVMMPIVIGLAAYCMQPAHVPAPGLDLRPAGASRTALAHGHHL